MNNMFKAWTEATAALPWGVQRVFHDTFTLVKDEKVHLVHGSDYRDGKPCLVNAVGQMTVAGGGHGIPSMSYSTIVVLFDKINREFDRQGVNAGDGYVSPLAAEILLHHFAPLKDKPVEADVDEAGATAEFEQGVYVEPKDEDFARDLMNAMQAPAPEDIADADKRSTDPVVEFTAQYVEARLKNE